MPENHHALDTGGGRSGYNGGQYCAGSGSRLHDLGNPGIKNFVLCLERHDSRNRIVAFVQ